MSQNTSFGSLFKSIDYLQVMTLCLHLQKNLPIEDIPSKTASSTNGKVDKGCQKKGT
ncbi:MAG: hypothetical protein U0525_04320 [Patescibacteria group bacterium]